MKIYSVYDPEFCQYGRVVESFDNEAIMNKLNEVLPPSEGVSYRPEIPELMELDCVKDLSDRLFGGMPVELGACWGHNTKLNCLEYHRDSEINLGTEDCIVLIAKQEEIGKDYMLDTANVKAFKVPAGVMFEMYATTLHYAPCHADKSKGFKNLVLLPKGTNLDKPVFEAKTHEDTLLTARNKWLLAHPDSDEAKNGSVVGLKGVNIDIADDI